MEKLESFRVQVSNCDKKLNASLFTVCGNLAVGLDGGAISGNRFLVQTCENVGELFQGAYTFVAESCALCVTLFGCLCLSLLLSFPMSDLSSQSSLLVSFTPDCDDLHSTSLCSRLIHAHPCDSHILITNGREAVAPPSPPPPRLGLISFPLNPSSCRIEKNSG